MSALIFLIFASLAIAILFLIAFTWAVRSGQYEDTSTPAMRLLTEDFGQGGTAPSKDAPMPVANDAPAVPDKIEPAAGNGCVVARPNMEFIPPV